MNTNKEYALLQLQCEAKKDILSTDIDTLRYMHENMGIIKKIYNDIQSDILEDRSSKLSIYIQKTISETASLPVNIEVLDEFFSSVYKSKAITTRNITSHFKEKENIGKIRLEYLNNLSVEFNENMKKVQTRAYDEKFIKKHFVSGSYTNKKKEQLVEGVIEDQGINFLSNLIRPDTVNVNNVFIQNNIIPFIREYAQAIIEMDNLGIKLKAAILKNNVSMQNSIDLYRRMMDDNQIPEVVRKNMYYYMQAFIKINIELISYITSMYMRKLSYYTYNITSVMNLYNTIHNYFPEGELVLHENVSDLDIEDIDNSDFLNSVVADNMSIVKPYLSKIIGIKKMEIANTIANKFNYKIDYDAPLDLVKYPYDTYPYAECNKSIIDIAKSLQSFENLTKDKDLIVDQMIQNSGLSESFLAKYDKVLSEISDIEFYTSQRALMSENSKEYTIMCMYNEIVNFEKNIDIITNNISKVYQYIDKQQDSLRVNDDNYGSVELPQMQAFMDTTMKNYKDYVVLLAKKLISRLEDLVNLIEVEDNDEETSLEPQEFVPYDYNIDAFVESYKDILMLENEIFSDIYKEVYKENVYNTTGKHVIYTEAEETEKVDEGDKTSPTVTVNKDDADSDKEDGENKSNDDEKKSIFQRLKEWFLQLIEKFLNKSKSLIKANDAWYKKNSSKIKNVKPSGLSISVAEYGDVTQSGITEMFNKVISKINLINTTTPQSNVLTEDQAVNFFFRDTLGKASSAGELAGDLVKKLTYDGEPTLKKYTGDDAVKKISEMTEYYEGYSTLTSSIGKEVDKMLDAWDKKYSSLSDENKKKVGHIGAILRKFGTSILTATEKKVVDYIKVFKAVVSSQGGDSSEAKTETDDKQKEDE